MFDTDILVVGAGPTGLTLAANLAAHHVDTVVVDGLAAGANTSRAAAINARTLEVLEDLDVSRRLVKAGLQVPRFIIRDRARTLMPIDFTALPTAYPYTLTIPQCDTEMLLLERLTELGGTVQRPTKLVALSQDADGATATLDDGQTLRARYVVGADGMRSTVRQSAGIGFGGSEYPESFMLADAHLQGEVSAEEVVLFWERAGLTVVAPLPDGQYRVVAPMADPPDAPQADVVQRLLDERGLGRGRVTVTDVSWSSRFRIHHRVADTYRNGRLLLAGDAAHVHSPAGGQGMNLGIQDAIALSDSLIRVLTGEPENLLDDYAQSRRPLAEQVLSLTSRMTRLATVPPAVRPLRNMGLGLAGSIPAVRSGLAWRLSGLVYR